MPRDAGRRSSSTSLLAEALAHRARPCSILTSTSMTPAAHQIASAQEVSGQLNKLAIGQVLVNKEVPYLAPSPARHRGIGWRSARQSPVGEWLWAADKVVFVSDWLPGGDKALPFYAMHKGLFAAEGLEVTIRTARGSSLAIDKHHDRRRRYPGSGGVGCALPRARAEKPMYPSGQC